MVETSLHHSTGRFFVHIYMTVGNIVKFYDAAEFTVPKLSVESDAHITVDFADGRYNVNVDDIKSNRVLDSVRIAVWSDEDGQKDIKWYGCEYDPAVNKAGVSYNASDFSNYGGYNVHVYARGDGKDFFLGAATYEINKPSAKIIDIKSDVFTGEFDVSIGDIKEENSIDSIRAAVWSKQNQSDIVWYNVEKNPDGDYIVKSDISKHDNNCGPFNAHVYIKDNSGKMVFADAGQIFFEIKADALKAVKTNEKVELKAEGLSIPKTAKAVSFAVWSEENGQDDLKWFDASYDPKKDSVQYKFDMNRFRSYGKYYVHAYVTLVNGEKAYLGASEFVNKGPEYSEFATAKNEAEGTFELKLKGLKSGNGISKVEIGVWSKSNQSDMAWYTAQEQADGSYSVSSDISRHKYNLGTYHAHVYVTEKNGIKSFLTAKDFDINAKAESISITEQSKQKEYKAVAKKLIVPKGAKKVEIAVWSDSNGQDDLKWYTMSGSNGGDYTAVIDIANHKTSGKYQGHVYAATQSGSLFYIGGTSFDVNSSASAENFSFAELSGGKFDVKFNVNKATSDISQVRVAAWTKSDMSDCAWYTAKKQADGSYALRVDTVNHKANIGNYSLHVYTTFSNGIQAFTGAGSYKYSPKDFLGVYKPRNTSRTLSWKNTSFDASSVKFGVWSDDKGQDDVVWYNASKDSNGDWSVTISTTNHKSSGTFSAHCYADGKFVGAVNFTVDNSEMVKNGWYYESGYKFYYINGVRQTDIRNIIGPQASYRIDVNRVCNTVTIYTSDGENGYITPVCAFTCSVGLPHTPTYPGTYSVGMKYRWKELMGPSYGQYVSAVAGQPGVYFHSVAGYNQSSYNLDPRDYNNLGNAASHGCIRLNVRDAKWIYDNCGFGTQINIFDSNSPGPMGKPMTIKIPAWQNWDPTDPNI